MIEGSKLEYGNIENCKFDSDLRSKIGRLVTFRGKVTKIEYGNIDFEKVIIETVTSTRR